MVRLTARGFGASAPRRRQRQRGRAGDQPADRVHPAAAGRTDTAETGPRRGGAGRAAAEVEAFPGEACAAEIDAILAERSIQFAAGAATLAEESGPVHRGDRRGAARLPRDRLRDRRLHRLPGLGEREPAAEPGACRGGAGGAARAGAGAGGVGGAAATARRTRSPTTPPPRGGRRTGGSPSRRSRARQGRGAGRRGRRRGGGARRRRAADTACVEAASAVVARTSIQFAAGSADARARERARSSTRSRRRCGAARTWRWRSAGTPIRRAPRRGNERLSQRRAEAVLAALRDARSARCRR